MATQAHEPERPRRKDRVGDSLGEFLRASAYLSFELYLTCCVAQTIAEGKTITGDLGGKSSTKEYTSTIIDKILKA